MIFAATPKEILPIVDKQTILYIVEEAIESSIEHIIIVTGKSKRTIEDHFDYSFELEHNLKEKQKFIFWKKTKHLQKSVSIISVKKQKV